MWDIVITCILLICTFYNFYKYKTKNICLQSFTLTCVKNVSVQIKMKQREYYLQCFFLFILFQNVILVSFFILHLSMIFPKKLCHHYLFAQWKQFFCFVYYTRGLNYSCIYCSFTAYSLLLKSFYTENILSLTKRSLNTRANIESDTII